MPDDKRLCPEIRDRELEVFAHDIAELCRKYGVRIATAEEYGKLVVYDERYPRPTIWPVAAYIDSVGPTGPRNLSIQSFITAQDWADLQEGTPATEKNR